ncbi:1-hydroxycarotenoid 3,4-desaturase CrtD [Methylocystis parvus]|uniref:1-hydroxycarotenoid 3,4-desaturase CrtD n=1 Tax=Methylocystis parvus TaxID=134 RepID=UPI003C71E5E7
MRKQRVIVIGAGVGGLVAALLLASRGLDVTVVERADAPGGKMREVDAGGRRLDAGPTVFTMRWVFDQIFDEAGADFAQHVRLHRNEILARHAWPDGARLDLFADLARSAGAVGDFAGRAEAEGFLRFAARARGIYDALRDSFILAQRPTPVDLVRHAGIAGLPGLLRISPFTTMWDELGKYFRNPRLRQLFGRYATYCGSSPFSATATLMLVASVELEGVWRVEGGMHSLARALANLAQARGAAFLYGREAERILVESGRVAGVMLADGETLDAGAVIMNGDVAALRRGLLGEGAQGAAGPTPRAEPSLSAVTLAMRAHADGFPLVHHNVFFSRDYRAEFDDLFTARRVPREPTIYVCAQDRDDGDEPRPDERLFALVNAPAGAELSQEEMSRCEETVSRMLADCGLRIRAEATTRTTPMDFDRLFPATGGAIYGQAAHGWTASFTRPGARTRLPGLYLAGGSVHPGPGVPMAAISGRLAAHCLMADLISTRPSRRAAIAGGMSTR